jgi:hypothetical protein
LIPDNVPADGLNRKALAIVEPRRRKAEEAAAALYQEGASKGRASEDIGRIVPDADAGGLAGGGAVLVLMRLTAYGLRWHITVRALLARPGATRCNCTGKTADRPSQA